MQNRKNIKVVVTLTCVATLMFGFGYAMVPMYRVFCNAWGLNGKTGRISAATAYTYKADLQRNITIEFDANVNSELSWAFQPVQKKISVHPGQLNEALYQAENLSDHQITAQAVPSVAPSQAAIYFNKTECFCFSQQTLGPHEKKLMPVKFIVDPHIPANIDVLTLSYTFYQTQGPISGVERRADKPDKNI